jgi:DNA-binding MarR family transcriptional regulator
MASRRTRAPGMALTAATVPSALDFDGLDRLFGYCLRRAQGAVHRDYLATVDELKLTQKQTAVMWLVQANPGVSQGGIGEMLGIDRATMMALVDRLESRGLLMRRRSAVDARLRVLHATAVGTQIMRRLRKRIAVHESRMKRLFTTQELRKLELLLTRLHRLGSQIAD